MKKLRDTLKYFAAELRGADQLLLWAPVIAVLLLFLQWLTGWPNL